MHKPILMKTSQSSTGEGFSTLQICVSFVADYTHEKYKKKDFLVNHMEQVTLEQVNKNVLLLKEELDEIKGLLEENNLELTEEVKKEILQSRKKPIREFKTQADIEKKFL